LPVRHRPPVGVGDELELRRAALRRCQRARVLQPPPPSAGHRAAAGRRDGRAHCRHERPARYPRPGGPRAGEIAPARALHGGPAGVPRAALPEHRPRSRLRGPGGGERKAAAELVSGAGDASRAHQEPGADAGLRATPGGEHRSPAGGAPGNTSRRTDPATSACGGVALARAARLVLISRSTRRRDEGSAGGATPCRSTSVGSTGQALEAGGGARGRGGRGRSRADYAAPRRRAPLSDIHGVSTAGSSGPRIGPIQGLSQTRACSRCPGAPNAARQPAREPAPTLALASPLSTVLAAGLRPCGRATSHPRGARRGPPPPDLGRLRPGAGGRGHEGSGGWRSGATFDPPPKGCA
jgi:hypothetical protein